MSQHRHLYEHPPDGAAASPDVSVQPGDTQTVQQVGCQRNRIAVVRLEGFVQFFELRVVCPVLGHVRNLLVHASCRIVHEPFVPAPSLDFLLCVHPFRVFVCYLIIVPMAPVAVILACCATPSPKFRVEKAVSPSGIIHAAKSGTRFRHFNATMLAAIR